MSSPYSPESPFFREPNSEKPERAPAPQQSDHEPLKRPEVDEDTVLSEMRLQDPERFKTLKGAEVQLGRAFGENPEPLYKDKEPRLVVKRKDIPFWRVFDLTESLSALEQFKDQLPERYRQDMTSVIENAKLVPRLFAHYVAWGEGESGMGPLDAKGVLVDLLVQLRRIDPKLFPRDLVPLTDEEFKLLTVPVERLEWDGLLREAQLAEYDADRFRRLFRTKFPRERIAKERAYWASVDEGNRGLSRVPNCSRAWQTIEKALGDKEEKEASTPAQRES